MITKVHDQVYVCGIQALSEHPIPEDVTRIITVCQDEITDHIPTRCAYEWYQMSDGPENSYGGNSSYEMFEQAADSMYRALQVGEVVLIHCHVGQSRSVSVASAALAAYTRGDVVEIMGHIKDERGNFAYPDGNLIRYARRFVR